MAAKDYINLEMPSIMGMGAVGPTLAVLTASMYQALESSMASPPGWSYPLIMLVLAGLLAVFPTSRAKFPLWQRACLWPLAAIVIFSAAWGTNHGLSSGEDVLSKVEVDTAFVFPSLIPAAYAQTTNAVKISKILPAGPLTNQVTFAKLDMAKKTPAPASLHKGIPKSVWGLSWPRQGTAILKDGKGKWWLYREKKVVVVKPPQVPPETVQQFAPSFEQSIQQKTMRGGFFKRF